MVNVGAAPDGVDRDGVAPGGVVTLSPSPPRFSAASASAEPRRMHGIAVVSRAQLELLPATAAEARARAAVDAAAVLDAEASASGVCRQQRDRTRTLCLSAHMCVQRGIPRGTGGHDSSGFNWVRSFSLAHGFSWMRPFVVPPESMHAEGMFYALALFHISGLIPPATRKAAEGFTRGQPPSALNAIYGYRRVMRDCGRFLADL